MLTTVSLKPVGRDPFSLTLTDEPEYAESAMGGPTVATVSCVTPMHRDRLLDARVHIFPPRGVPWIGRVASIRQDGELAELACTGPQADLDRVVVGPLLYCDTALFIYEPRVPRSDLDSTPHARLDTASAGLSIIFPAGQAITADDKVRCGRFIPESASVRIEFDYVVPTSMVLAVSVWTGTGSGTQVGSTIEAGSGSFAQTIAAATYNSMYFTAGSLSSRTPAADETIRITNLKVYGVAGITSVTAPNVINHIASAAPSWMLNDSQAWVEADATTIEPLTFDADATALNVLEEIAQFRDFDLSVRAKLIGGEYVPAIVYSPRDDTPSYQVFPGFAGTLDLTGQDITAAADSVRVRYSDEGGRSRYVDVSETSEDNYLVTIGQGRRAVMLADTASEATATLMGQRFLALRRKVQVAGTLELEGEITDFRGAPVLPCEIQAGRYIRLHGTPYGTVNARIVEVVKRGMRATLTLDNTPTALDTELALLTKRQR